MARKTQLVGIRFLVPENTAEKLKEASRAAGFTTVSDFLRHSSYQLIEKYGDDDE